jgi:hypothetical protein
VPLYTTLEAPRRDLASGRAPLFGLVNGYLQVILRLQIQRMLLVHGLQRWCAVADQLPLVEIHLGGGGIVPMANSSPESIHNSNNSLAKKSIIEDRAMSRTT